MCHVSRYRGVSRPKYKGRVRGWLAQDRKAHLWKIGFATQEGARDWLAGALGVSPSSLAKSGGSGRSGRTCVTSTYRGVFGRTTRRGVLRWYVRANGKHLAGSFSTEVAAARFRSQATCSRAKVTKHTTQTRKRARDMFIAAYAVFKSYMPGDLVATREQESDSAMQQEHTEYCVSLSPPLFLYPTCPACTVDVSVVVHATMSSKLRWCSHTFTHTYTLSLTLCLLPLLDCQCAQRDYHWDLCRVVVVVDAAHALWVRAPEDSMCQCNFVARRVRVAVSTCLALLESCRVPVANQHQLP